MMMNNNNHGYPLLFFILTILLMIQTIIEQHHVGVVVVVDALIINGNNHHHHRLVLHRPDCYDSVMMTRTTTRTRTTTSLLNSAVTNNIASVITTSTSTTSHDYDNNIVGSTTKSTPTPTTAPTNPTATATATTKSTSTNTNTNTQHTSSSSSSNTAAVPVTTIVVLPESIWRTAALNHRTQIQKLLQPGLVNKDHPLMAAIISQRKRQQKEQIRQRKQQQQQKQQQKLDNKDEKDEITDENDHDQNDEGMMNNMTVLDPKHPVYNFLVEYYGLKGLKGPKRLARWSPSISLLLFNVRTSLEDIEDDNDEDSIDDNNDITNDDDNTTTTSKSTSTSKTTKIKTITSLQELNDASSFAFISNNGNDIVDAIDCIGKENDGIFLEGATPDDFAVILHLKGAEWIDGNNNNDDVFGHNNTSNDNNKSGVLYRPFRCYNDVVVVVDDDNDEDTDNVNDVIAGTPLETVISSSSSNNNHNYNTNHNKIASYIWYKSILETTIQSEPILHCYGLHEWAMQYHPVGAEKPPSGKYQQHLPLRVSREIINTTVERKGLRCTHVDALRFFAPAAAPLNHHGSFLEREDQLRLEQSGCVHSHMDLLKIALKLIPYCDSQLLVDIVDIALEARTLDVGASPYDCSQYKYADGQDILMIPVETTEGRKQYKELQTKLMYKTESIRKRLLINYNLFLKLCFTPDEINIAIQTPNINEQYTYTKPGGLPWRKSLIDDKINK